MAAKRPFTINPVLTAIAMGYANRAMIADEVAPRVNVPAEAFKYSKYGKEDFRPTGDKVGRTGRTNRVEFSQTQHDGSVEDHGLEDPVPQSDIDQAATAGVNYDPLGVASLKLSKVIELNREIRVAAIVHAAASYPTGNKVQLSGTDQWSDFTNSDPYDDIMTAMDGMLIRPNTMVVGGLVLSKLRAHPALGKAVGGANSEGRKLTRQELADLFEVERILSGDAWNNTANKGQTESMGRIWGKHCALLHIEPQPADMNEITFMATAQFGTRFAGDWEDRDIGLKGGRIVRVGEQVRELVLASDVGYFIEDAIA